MRINRPLGARPQWHQQAEGDELGPRSLILTVGLRVFCWLVWSSPTTLVSRFFPELPRQTLVGKEGRRQASQAVVSAQPTQPSWGDFIHFKERVRAGMRPRVKVRGRGQY